MKFKKRSDVTVPAKVKKAKKIRTPFAKYMILVTKIVVIIILAATLTLTAIIGGAIIGYIKSAPLITADQLQLKGQTTIFYDLKGKEIAKLTGSDNIDRIMVED
ncbi:MAG: hypothetical protein WC677_03845, partial [Clostridia bacterium]